jgi:pSer/pThr/pTyr-binding forkhead associated (FHA) protein
MAKLVRLLNEQEYPLPEEREFKIGRGSDSNICVLEEGVSRTHCVITKSSGDSGEYVLTDRSKNGTFVNEKRTGQVYVLRGEDIIGVGTHRFKFSSK